MFNKNETRVKIGFVVGGVLLLIGTILAVYFVATGPATSTWLAMCLGPVGGGGAIAMIAIGSYSLTHNDRYAPINYEHTLNGSEESPFSVAMLTERILTLSTGTIESMYGKYYRKNGGLGPLVRQGYILPEQGDRLRTLLASYHTQIGTISDFNQRALCKQAIDQGNIPEAYKTANNVLDQVRCDWQQLRQEIANQYQS